MQTTLNKMRACEPCAESWQKYLRHVGKTQPDDEPIEMSEILAALGLEDAVWSLRGFDGAGEEAVRKYAVFCARQMWDDLTDDRSRMAIAEADNYAHGEVSREVMIAARNEAMQALNGDASEAAEACARVDAFDAAWSAVVLAAKHVPADVLTQEFEQVFCND